MNKRSVIISMGILLNLAIAFFPVIPVLKTVLPSTPTAKEQLDAYFLVVGLSLATISAMIGLLLYQESDDRRKGEKGLEKSIRAMSGSALADHEFYGDFLHAVSRADRFVCITYLAPYPPDEAASAERQAYYRDLSARIRTSTEVRFRRIVRETPRTREWIGRLLTENSGIHNLSIAILDEQPDVAMPLALSVQIVDGIDVWFVAIRSHEQTTNYRDVHINSPAVAEGMVDYYDRLWARSKMVLDSGRITQDGRRFVNSIAHGFGGT